MANYMLFSVDDMENDSRIGLNHPFNEDQLRAVNEFIDLKNSQPLQDFMDCKPHRTKF